MDPITPDSPILNGQTVNQVKETMYLAGTGLHAGEQSYVPKSDKPELPSDIQFPDELPIDNLLFQNECYDATKITIHEALYHGGDKFEAIKNLVLWKRELEDKPAGKGMRKARMQCASYTPHVSGFIDFLAACIFQNDPRILFKGPADKLIYYNTLNCGFPSLLHGQFLSLVNHGHAYQTIIFPDLEMEYSDLQQQLEAGALDAKICALDHQSIVDWDRVDGELEFIKTHSIDILRNNPWEAPNAELHTWTYITMNTIYEYQATRELCNGKPKKWDHKKDFGILVKEVPFTVCPFTELTLTNHFCLMGSVKQLVLAIFNRDASLDYSLNSSAFSLMVLYTEKALTEILASEMAALHLGPADKCEILNANNDVFEALRNNTKDKQADLSSRINSAALNIASIDQHAASGAAKVRDFGPIAILLEMYGEILKNSIIKDINKIIKMRGDEDVITFEVKGLDEFDITALDQKIKQVTEFVALPISKTAKNWALNDVAQMMCASAPPEVQEEIKKEQEEMDEESAEEPKDDTVDSVVEDNPLSSS